MINCNLKLNDDKSQALMTQSSRPSSSPVKTLSVRMEAVDTQHIGDSVSRDSFFLKLCRSAIEQVCVEVKLWRICLSLSHAHTNALTHTHTESLKAASSGDEI